MRLLGKALTFDDVLLVPPRSGGVPATVGVRSKASPRRGVEGGGGSERCPAEDGDLWGRRKTHARVLSSAESRVATSARMHGRAPAGFAGHLVSLDQSAFPSRQPAHPCGCQDVDHAGCHELTPARSAS